MGTFLATPNEKLFQNHEGMRNRGGLRFLDVLEDIAAFADGSIKHTSVLGLGGYHISNDIAVGLRTPFDEAERIGLINGVFEPDQLLPGVVNVAERILSRGPQAVALAKQAVHRGAHLSLTDGLRLEADLFGMASSPDEMKEGTQAFLEKRKPNW